jgi:hypothetical protein
MLSSESDIIVEDAVNTQANSVSQEFGLVIPSEVRNFLTEIVKESLIWRENEWLERQQLNINDPDVIRGGRFRSTLTNNLSEVLIGTAQTDELVELYKRLTLIGTIDWIRQNWCGVFPICR